VKASDILTRVVLWSVLPVAAAWMLFGRTEMRRIARDEEHLEKLVDKSQLRNGDLIFHTSESRQSKAIQLATRSAYSHCGIIYKRTGQWVVFEAVQPVKTTPLRNWIARGKDEHFVIKRLRDAETALTPAALARMDSVGKTFMRRRYDASFNWSDDEIYCSELVWKVYDRGLHRRLGQLQQLKEFNLSPPAVQKKLKERYGDRLPLSETVISPVSIFNSPELVTVLNR
jgi:uncharacterized protein YycO